MGLPILARKSESAPTHEPYVCDAGVGPHAPAVYRSVSTGDVYPPQSNHASVAAL